MNNQWEIYRYSPRTIFGYGMVWAIMFLAQLLGFAYATRQYILHADDTVFFPALFGAFAAVLAVSAAVWIREKPILKLSDTGLMISKLGTPTVHLSWSDILRIEDFRRFNVQTGRPLRYVLIHWDKGSADFSQYYVGFRRLIARLNEQIQKHHIEILVHNYDPHLVRSAIASASSASQKKEIRRNGVILKADLLQEN